MAGRLLASASDDDDNVWLGWFEAVAGPAIRQWCQWWRIDLIRFGGALIRIFDFCSRDRFYQNGAEKWGGRIYGWTWANNVDFVLEIIHICLVDCLFLGWKQRTQFCCGLDLIEIKLIKQFQPKLQKSNQKGILDQRISKRGFSSNL